MSSLRWICVVTLALLCCLTAQPIPLNKEELKFIRETISTFSTKVKEVKCQDAGPTYYAPVDVKDDCLGSALNCSLIELEMLIDNCETDIKEASEDLITILNVLSNSEPQCSFTCEVFPQMPFKEFLENMETLIEQKTSASQ